MAEITLTIPDELVSEFKIGFLKQNPIPTDEDGAALYTDAQWFKESIRQWALSIYKQGKRKLAQEAAYSIEEDIIQ